MPSNWLHDEMCYWPENKQSQKAKNRTDPDKDWSTFKYKTLKSNIGKLNNPNVGPIIQMLYSIDLCSFAFIILSMLEWAILSSRVKKNLCSAPGAEL